MAALNNQLLRFLKNLGLNLGINSNWRRWQGQSALDFGHPYQSLLVLIRVSIVVVKHHGQKHVGEEKVYLPYTSTP